MNNFSESAQTSVKSIENRIIFIVKTYTKKSKTVILKSLRCVTSGYLTDTLFLLDQLTDILKDKSNNTEERINKLLGLQ